MEKNENLIDYYYELGLTSWEDLPGTEKEVEEIKNKFPESKIVKGMNVNEAYIKKLSSTGELKKNKIIHFASHGFTYTEIPVLSSIVLSASQKGDKEDGFLTMKEIGELDINAEFVNLSACETGLGKIYGGEGVVGLTQSFLIAGAASISVSLWAVSDEGTKEFMSLFYNILKEEKCSYDTALTQTKRLFIKNDKYSNPFYWACFVYYGK